MYSVSAPDLSDDSDLEYFVNSGDGYESVLETDHAYASGKRDLSDEEMLNGFQYDADIAWNRAVLLGAFPAEWDVSQGDWAYHE